MKPKFPLLKIALPEKLDARNRRRIGIIVLNQIQKERVQLLLDASGIEMIDADGIRWIYQLIEIIRSFKLPKIIIRNPNRVMRDALLLSNTLKYFEIREVSL
jgi:anti-anti-sigma regulatory factor